MTDKEIDDIYDTVDDLMTKGRWELLDNLLEFYTMQAEHTELDELITWATSSLPGKSKLMKRAKFIEACLKFHSDPEQPDLWRGLE